MNLDTLAETISRNFGEPFLDAGAVECRIMILGDGTKALSLDIGPRNVWIDENGKCIASGSRMWFDSVTPDTPVIVEGVH